MKPRPSPAPPPSAVPPWAPPARSPPSPTPSPTGGQRHGQVQLQLGCGWHHDGVGGSTAGFFNGPSGTLTLGNRLTLYFSTPSLAPGRTYNRFDFGSHTGILSSVSLTGSIIGSRLYSAAADTWTSTNSLNSYHFSLSEASSLLSVSAIPAPSTYAAIFGALALADATLYRRRKG